MRLPALAVLYGATAAAAVPDVGSFAAISRNETVRLLWTNPADHSGVLVLRATEPISATPVDGVTYTAGATIGNATVAYADSQSSVSVFDDSGRTNGVKYHYRIHNIDAQTRYSSGNVPSSSGLSSTPASGAGTSPKWCYALGAAAVMQPIGDRGAGVFFAGNGGTINASRYSSDAAADGDERWRPVALTSAVQGRFPVVTLWGDTAKTILTGDGTGHAYAIDASTGTLAWTGLSGEPLGDAIVAQPVVQLRAYANAAYVAAHPERDLVFFATRNTSTTGNAVFALDGSTGAEVWRYAPGDLDAVSGGMMVDYSGNRVFVAARSNGGTQPSLHVLDSLTGARVAALSLGDFDTGVVLNPTSGQALAASAAGSVYGIALSDLSIAFQASVGAPASWPFPAGTGFIVSLTSGAVERWTVSGATASRSWTTAIADPSGVTLEYGAQVAYVGSSDGRLHQLSLATGADQQQIDFADGAVGAPSIDTLSKRLYAGTVGGHVCAFELP